jgi:hypothetical protein
LFGEFDGALERLLLHQHMYVVLHMGL